MKFVRIDRTQASGSGYQGLIKIRYPELCAIFGQPEGPSGDGKVQAEWAMKIAGDVIAKIYDYKEDQPPRELLLWHIGGKHPDVVQLVEILIKEYRKANK